MIVGAFFKKDTHAPEIYLPYALDQTCLIFYQTSKNHPEIQIQMMTNAHSPPGKP